MKKFIYQKLYRFLSKLSNHFPNRTLTAWKVTIGTSLLLLSGGFTQPRQKNQFPDDLVRIPLVPTTGEQPEPEEDILCYEPSLKQDSIPADNNATPSTSATEQEVTDGATNYDFVCYIIIYPEMDDEPIDENEIYTVVEIMPKPTEGHIYRYTNEDRIYPSKAWKQGIEGRVILQFVIEKDGSINQISVARGVHPLLDKAAVKIVKKYPNFTPAQIRGKPVRVLYAMPIIFKINKEEEQSEN